MRRVDGRRADETRPVRMIKGFLKNSPSSVLIAVGDTRVLCVATVEERVPPWLSDTGMGWVTAEYGMLPGSTSHRKPRESKGVGGRTAEIQRLVGRVLRAVTDLGKLGERTIRVDCDVLDADGGTRTASITGAWVALADCVERLKGEGLVTGRVLREAVAAVSVGVVEGKVLLDLTYEEDSAAEVDMNVAMTSTGKFVEVQGTAEGRPFDAKVLDTLLKLGGRGVKRMIAKQREVLKGK